MALSPGTKLGPYEIVRPLGAGGMGEVYLARDARLDRTVAVKVLPQHLSASAELRQRFEREARAASSLNHPNICTIHDIGSEADTDYMVMEHLEGETLAVRLQRGPLPAEEALKIAIQIADALDKAHRQGLIHRDLKPGNVMLTKTGAKLLDFGLAKSAGPTSGGSPMTSAPTMTSPLTAEGVIVGTFQYMAPEQLEGSEASTRSDIFAFGTMLYEMVTGQRAFEGKTQASLVAAILKEQPRPISALQPLTPPALERLVATCLEKDPDERRQSMHDVLLELRWIVEGGSQAGVPAPARARRRSREKMAWTVAVLAIIFGLTGLLAAWLFQAREAPAFSRQPIWTNLVHPEGGSFSSEWRGMADVAIAPDEGRLVYAAEGKLWLRALGAPAPVPLDGTEDGGRPFWSADGRSIGFFANDKLKTIPADGGPVTVVCDAAEPRGGAWNREGVIVFAPDLRTGLMKVPAAGGAPEPLTTVDPSRHTTHRWPVFDSDGKHVFYLAANHSDPVGNETVIQVVDLEGGGGRDLLRSDSGPAFAGGYLLYLRDGNLMAQSLDERSLEPSGHAVRLAENVLYLGGSWIGGFAAAGPRLLAYQASGLQAGSQLTWFDRQGQVQGVLGDRATYWGFRISPDGRRIVAGIGAAQPHLWLFEPARNLRNRFTLENVFSRSPVYSPDGSRVAFAAMNDKSKFDVFEMPADGSSAKSPVVESEIDMVPTDWSPDGRHLLINHGPPGATQIWAVPLDGDRKPFPVVQVPPWATDGRFSPDGKWFAYTSRESGTDQVYVSPFPGPGGRWQISTGFGHRARWRNDGREIVFAGDNDMLTAVPLDLRGATPTIGKEQPLFQVYGDLSIFTENEGLFEMTGDGQRFLVAAAGTKSRPDSPITLELNWASALQAGGGTP